MTHVKCEYDKFVCSEEWQYGKDGEKCREEFNCSWNPRKKYDGDEIITSCINLESKTCFFETTNKNINFDGETLTVGRKFVAFMDDGADSIACAGDNIIKNLWIDEKQYVKDYFPYDQDAEEFKAYGRKIVDDMMNEPGWEVIKVQ